MRIITTALMAVTVMSFSMPAFAYHDKLDGLLKDNIRVVTKNNITYNGVNYDAWAKNPTHNEVRDEILATNPASLTTKNEKLAYWINAYNVLTIDLITREGERKSIKNLGGTLVSPWKKHKWTIAGKKYTLDNIEHEIIRPMGEARIHFAVNCAAKSCPDLRAESYRAEKLDAQLADQTQKTFANPTKGYKAVEGKNTVRVSKVMDWFKKDFNASDLKSWLKSYFPNTVNDETSIKFFDYDWSLNKQ